MPQHRPPGTYVEETRPTPPIEPAPTGVTAFVGHTLGGPVNRLVPVRSYTDYAKNFGGLAASSEVSYAVLQFFRNGGEKALIVRVPETETGLPDLGMIAGASTSFPMGLGCLEDDEEFDLLCLPDATRPRTPGGTMPEFKVERMVELWRAAADLCRRKRALALIDPPATAATTPDLQAFAAALPRESGAFAACYAPWIVIDDPLHQGQQRHCAPAGTMAGLHARFDKAMGVWKAPAGVDAGPSGVKALARRFTDTEQNILNPLGINLLRDFPQHGIVAWGARTLSLADEWRFVPVRRLASHIERSIVRGLGWAALEPNGEALWARLRQDAGDFLHALFKRGAFAGSAAGDAYFVKCDASTMTPADIAQGNCLIEIGFAPLTPAEFAIVRIALRTRPPPA
ncbi:MAG: phage tail sheath family protein [Reyranellaceae bacterium]